MQDTPVYASGWTVQATREEQLYTLSHMHVLGCARTDSWHSWSSSCVVLPRKVGWSGPTSCLWHYLPSFLASTSIWGHRLHHGLSFYICPGMILLSVSRCGRFFFFFNLCFKAPLPGVSVLSVFPPFPGDSM